MMSSVVVRKSISIFLDARPHRRHHHPPPHRHRLRLTSSKDGVSGHPRTGVRVIQGRGVRSSKDGGPGSSKDGGQGHPRTGGQGHPRMGVRVIQGWGSSRRHHRGWALFKRRPPSTIEVAFEQPSRHQTSNDISSHLRRLRRTTLDQIVRIRSDDLCRKKRYSRTRAHEGSRGNVIIPSLR